MASPFKIPKRKQPADGGSACLHMQSPLSRLQDEAGTFKKNWEQSSRGRADRVHAGNGLGSRLERESAPVKPLLRDVVKTLLGIGHPTKEDSGVSTANQRPGRTLGSYSANHRADHSAKSTWNHQSGSGTPTRQPGQRPAESSSSCFSNGWRPKRASDRLLQPNGKLEGLSPPQKKRSSSEFSDSVVSIKGSSVESVDSLLDLEDAGSWESRRDAAEPDRPERERSGSPEQNRSRRTPSSGTSGSASDRTSDEDFVSPDRTRTGTRTRTSADAQNDLSSSSSVSSVLKTSIRQERRPTLNRTSWLTARGNLRERERERESRASRSLSLQLRLRRPKQAPSEPIVLSSEEEEGEDDEGDGQKKTSDSSGRAESVRLQPPAAERNQVGIHLHPFENQQPPLRSASWSRGSLHRPGTDLS
uniref:uncharacterized protein n=1 Tax=Centroberyx gerrardi TaxID=166262 RepID=UPI003AAD43D8